MRLSLNSNRGDAASDLGSATRLGTLCPLTTDSHIHLLPGRLANKVRSLFDAHISRALVYPLDHGEVCERLAREGITEAWTLPYAHRAEVASGLNAASAAVVEAHRQGPLRLVGGCTVHPADEHAMAVVRAAVEGLGLRVLKLHCSVGDFTPDDRRLDAVWEYVSAVALPVVVRR